MGCGSGSRIEAGVNSPTDKRRENAVRLKPVLMSIVACSFTSTVFAGSYHDVATVYGAAQLHDDAYQNQVFWMSFDDPSGVQHHATALRVNEHYGLTAAHVFAEAGFSYSNHVVGNGSNYRNRQAGEKELLVTRLRVNPRVSLVEHLGHERKVFATEAVGLLPVVAVLVEASHLHVVPNTGLGLVGPDGRLDAAESNLVCGFLFRHF